MPRLIALLFAAGLGLFAQPVDNAWLFLVDDLHHDFIQTGRLRTLLRSATSELIHDDDRFLLRASGPSQKSLPAAVDRDQLASSIKFITGNGLKAVDILRADPTGATAKEVLFRAHLALDSLDNAVTALVMEDARRKTIILISAGYDVDAFPPLSNRVNLLVRRATDRGIVIFAIDARGFDPHALPDARVDASAWQRYMTSTRRSLSLIADSTGGFVIERPIEPAEALKRIEAQMR